MRTKFDPNEYAFYIDNKNQGSFVNDQADITTIVTSSAQNDREYSSSRFDDESYSSFECAAAISSWKLQMNPVYS